MSWKLSGSLLKMSKTNEFNISDYESLYFLNRLCVPNTSGLKRDIFHEAHNNIYTMHLGGNEMYNDLK